MCKREKIDFSKQRYRDQGLNLEFKLAKKGTDLFWLVIGYLLLLRHAAGSRL